MKKIKNLLFALSFFGSTLSSAQSTSSGVGAGNNWGATKYLGWGLVSGDLPMRTNFVTRVIILDNTGYVGIGDNFLTPTFRLHINDGGILSTGNTFGAGTILPNGLTNARMIWYPRKAACKF